MGAAPRTTTFVSGRAWLCVSGLGDNVAPRDRLRLALVPEIEIRLALLRKLAPRAKGWRHLTRMPLISSGCAGALDGTNHVLRTRRSTYRNPATAAMVPRAARQSTPRLTERDHHRQGQSRIARCPWGKHRRSFSVRQKGRPVRGGLDVVWHIERAADFRMRGAPTDHLESLLCTTLNQALPHRGAIEHSQPCIGLEKTRPGPAD